ncbi:MAG TPA: pantoate--beta-alanine ligase, partial [bacterium]|nr:pantoate--beta-alanine ligase [bacterium]
MKTLSNPHLVQEQARAWRQAKRSIGFVPTMGALHDGHLELVRICRKQNKVTVVSIYVNPLQFGPNEDFNKYPRALEKDLELLKKEKVHLVFTPSDKEMYPKGYATDVKVKGPLVAGLCAPFRPGHFDGVATVVVKLLGAVQPDRLYLGQKDAQQLAVLRQVVLDLNIDTEVVGCPIVRERDGLAMSSRNTRLSLAGRKIAPVLYKALKVGKSVYELGENETEKVLVEIKKVIKDERKVKLQYLEAVDAVTLEPVQELGPGTMLALAAHLENV